MTNPLTNADAVELERLRFSLESAQIGTWSLDIRQQQVWWDDRCKQLYGFHQDDIVPYDQVLSYMHDDDRQRVDQAVSWALSPESGGYYDIQFRTVGSQDGQVRWLHCRGQANFDADGLAYRFAGTAQDITQQVLDRQNALLNETQFQTLIKEAPVATSLFVGRELRVAVANEPMLAIWGKGPNQIGRTLADILPEIANQPFLAILDEVYTSGQTYSAKGGRADLIINGVLGTYYFDFTYKPLMDADNRVYAILQMAVDVTPQVVAQQKLIASEAHFRNIVEQALSPICLLKGEEMVLELGNQPLLDVWNTGPEALGQPLLEILPEMRNQPIIQWLSEVYHNGVTHHLNEIPAYFIRKNGSREDRYFNFIFQPWYEVDGNISGVLALATDVTEQVHARQVVQDSDEQKTFLLQLYDQLRLLNDPTEVYYRAACLLGSRLGADRVGYAEDQGDGQTIVVMRNYTRNREVADLAGSYRYTDYGPLLAQFLTGETVVRPDIAQDPTLTDAEKEAHQLIQLGATVNMPLLRAGRPMTVLFMHYQQAHTWLDKELTLLKEVASQIIIAVERAEAEQALRESEQRYRVLSAELEQRVLQRTEELETTNQDLKRSNDNLQQFAYVASHDLQEPLRKIQSFSSLLAQQHRDTLGEAGQDTLQRIQVAGERMSTLIRDLLAYSRIATRQQTFGPTSLNAILMDVLSTLDWEIQQTSAQITADELPIVNGSAGQLGQLFQNLITNSLKFVQPGHTPRIYIQYAQRQPEELPTGLRPIRQAPFYHQISVKDAGVGFDTKYLDRIFQVFQRVHPKNQYPGTGVGLAICQRVVENHGGAITADSKPDDGATFCVYLPT